MSQGQMRLFMKFGQSTLAGYGGNDQGNEMFEVFQIDREKENFFILKQELEQRQLCHFFRHGLFLYR